MGWTLVCVLYMRFSLERTVKEKVSTYVDRHIITRLLGILGVHNEQKCIIWMFQKKGMIRYHLFTYVEMKGKIGRRGNSKSLFLSPLVVALPANYR